ncbi:MAG: ATP-binding cassette domain-containing protein, partial [Candidatus Devosia symbiotica]|nr:ATP-binding cassette domain-containing protein [Candidatus Devosia symbiotica]
KRLLGLNGALRGLFSHAFTEVHAVREISFAITADEAVVYLGPNGAGKSAMIKVMIGILVSSAGSLSALGRESHNHRMVNAAEIGVVFGQRS